MIDNGPLHKLAVIGATLATAALATMALTLIVGMVVLLVCLPLLR